MLRWPLVVGGLLALTAVMAGAFGAHGLRGVVSARGLEVFQTAVTYQMYHSLGLILLALLSGAGLSVRLLSVGAGFFAAGIVLFSGSLYLLVLTPMSWPGPVTPIGGVCFMVGWVLMVVAGKGSKRQV
ncbi:DUF423 domain-containing protein [Marinobacter halotolerans]|uniref:DUF423 domain-containing protein n=1 Tax=Marinobacter halotolerans TaxID=1569211 RepID=UPI00384CCF2B